MKATNLELFTAQLQLFEYNCNNLNYFSREYKISNDALWRHSF